MKEKVIYLLLILMILASCAGNRKYDAICPLHQIIILAVARTSGKKQYDAC